MRNMLGSAVQTFTANDILFSNWTNGYNSFILLTSHKICLVNETY